MARPPTVYDFSSLRLHPDGSSVFQKASQNQKPRYAARVVQDSRGNWFARDAAGSGAVGRYRKVKEGKDGKKEYEEEEEKLNDNDNDVYEGEEDELSKRKGKGQEEGISSRRKHNRRLEKRQKFSQNFDFLATPASDGSEHTHTHALPSSDLLKSIHYFASSYYHERGQLFNATKEYRRKRKENRLKKLGRQKNVEPDREGSVELDEDSEQNMPKRGGRKKGVTGRIIHRKDMYKMLDGSALMAIGMLMQEYVSRTLEVRVPDGWEDMMQDEEAMTEDEHDAENEGSNVDDDEDEYTKVKQDNSKRMDDDDDDDDLAGD